MTPHPFETMIAAISRLVRDGEVAAVGTLSPIPAAALYLAKRLHAPDMVPMVYNDPELRITDGLHEFFGLAHRGLIDLFFLSGIQIDRRGNFNLSLVGDYRKPKLRLPGGAGSNMMIMMAKRTIFFTITHDTRLFVPEVDFVNGTAADDSIPWRRGTLSHIVTPLCVMKYSAERRAVELESTFSGVPVETVARSTGFDLGTAGREIPETRPVTKEEMEALRGPVLAKMRTVYPLFCSMIWG